MSWGRVIVTEKNHVFARGEKGAKDKETQFSLHQPFNEKLELFSARIGGFSFEAYRTITTVQKNFNGRLAYK